MSKFAFEQKIVVRGGGDLATGVIQKFVRAGFPVVILEIGEPTAIRRGVALCEAVYDDTAQVEDIVCRKVARADECEDCWRAGTVPVLIDPDGAAIAEIRPAAVIDAILAKRNLGTHRGMAGITIALGPGFSADRDVNVVIETMRGHDLGRLIFEGSAQPDTGIPGDIGGKSAQRVLRAPAAGVIRHVKQLGDVAETGAVLFTVDGVAVRAPFAGVMRGLIREGLRVTKGMKVADMDPRADVSWRTISDKARSLGGAALEAYFMFAKTLLFRGC
jgi:xanthine dehydrogenase accessory factor